MKRAKGINYHPRVVFELKSKQLKKHVMHKKNTTVEVLDKLVEQLRTKRVELR